MDSILFFFLDRIYRIIFILSHFPDGSEKTQSASGGLGQKLSSYFVGIKSLLRCVAGELYRRLNIQYRQYWKVGPPSAAARNPER